MPGSVEHSGAKGRLLGASDVLLDVPSLLAHLSAAITNRKSTVFVGVYPALSYTAIMNTRYRKLLHGSCVYPDGTGSVYALRAQGCEVPERMATTDIIWDVVDAASKNGWRLMLYGARADVVAETASVLQRYSPDLKIIAAVDGYSDISTSVLRDLSPDLILVARGAPLQEFWSHDTAVPAGVPAIMTCGGLFDFISGKARRAPRWMQRSGLEWLYRVAQEPRRLLARYAFGNPAFVGWALVDTVVAWIARRRNRG